MDRINNVTVNNCSFWLQKDYLLSRTTGLRGTSVEIYEQIRDYILLIVYCSQTTEKDRTVRWTHSKFKKFRSNRKIQSADGRHWFCRLAHHFVEYCASYTWYKKLEFNFFWRLLMKIFVFLRKRENWRFLISQKAIVHFDAEWFLSLSKVVKELSQRL